MKSKFNVALRGRVPGNVALGFALLAALALATPGRGAVTMTAGVTAPTPGTHDQFNFTDDATIPGGTTPGGGTHNSQSFSDNNGPPGQTFTTPASASGALPAFALNSIWLKGANADTGNFGGGVFDSGNSFGIRVSEVTGTTLVPLKTVTGIPTTVGATGDQWFTWTFTGDDVRTLQPNKQYAFDVFSSNGWLGFDASESDGAYTSGTAFNSAGGGARNFNGVSLGDLSLRQYDRTFLVNLAPSVNIGPGDVNGDGSTTLADYTIIKTNFFKATGATRGQGDLDGNGRVDLADYALWKNNAPPAVVASAAVPEPASGALAALGAATLAAVARRRNIRFG